MLQDSDLEISEIAMLLHYADARSSFAHFGAGATLDRRVGEQPALSRAEADERPLCGIRSTVSYWPIADTDLTPNHALNRTRGHTFPYSQMWVAASRLA